MQHRFSFCFAAMLQWAEKVLSDSLKLADFAIGLVNSVLNLPDGQVKFFDEFKLHKNCVINPAYQKFLRLVEMNFGLVHASYSLPEWQPVKLTFFAPCVARQVARFLLPILRYLYMYKRVLIANTE